MSKNMPFALRALLIVATAATLVLAAACTSPKPSPTPPVTLPTSSQVEIAVSNFVFSPSTITIPAGSTVIWTNKDGTPHNVLSDAAGVFESGLLQQNESFSYTFTRSGAFPYHCVPHPSMKGTVFVQ